MPNNFDKAKTSLVIDHPFFAYLFLSSTVRISDSLPTKTPDGQMVSIPVNTAATDGKIFVFNPEFLETLSKAETIGVIVHEVLHKAFLHSERTQEGFTDKWHLAKDMAINFVVDEMKLTLPPGAIRDSYYPQTTGEGHQSAEKLYHLIPDDPDAPQSFDTLVPGSGDACDTADVKLQVAAARNLAKMQGKMPGVLDDMVTELLESKTDWKLLLRQFLQQVIGGGDYDWKRPNKRYVSLGLYLPRTVGLQAPEFAVIYDTSGSIYGQPEAVKSFNGEIEAIIQDLKPEKTHVICTDTCVQSHVEVDPFDIFSPALKGGGGTDFTEVFAYIAEHLPNVRAVICMTDLYASGLPGIYHIPILYATHSNPNPTVNYGSIVQLDDD